MTSIVATIPSVVMAGSGDESVPSYVHTDSSFDYAVNGIPFLSAVGPDHPAVRKTAPYRRPRLDYSSSGGDGAMDFWWLTGQTTFHGGAGQLYIDTPISQGAEIRPLRYQSSLGLNVWDQGKVTLHKDTTRATTHGSSAASKAAAIYTGSTNYVAYSDGTAVKILAETVAGTTYTVNTATLGAAFSANVQSVVTDGRYWYATDGNTVQKGDPALPGTASSVLYTGMGGGTAVLGFVKLMLMLGFTSSTTSKAYALDPTASSAALPAATFTHPTPSFVWTCVAEGPGAFYMGGYAGYRSTIYKFVLNTTTTVPTVSSGIKVTDLPPGELVLDMFDYLGSTLGIVTSQGLRVGQFGGNSVGDFSYGPLSVQFNSAVSAAGCTGGDRFLFCTYVDSAGTASLARVDLSQQLNVRPFSYTPDARFAWAPDLRAYNSSAYQTGTPTSVVALSDGRKVFVVPNSGVYFEHPTRYTASGTLVTSRIRFETLDPKLAKYLRVRGSGTGGSIAAAVNQDADSGGAQVISYDMAGNQDTGDVSVGIGQFTFATVTFTLTAGSSQTLTPTFLGYQLKCLPAQTRQRYIQVPLLCFDREKDDSGQEIGYDGYALSRLMQLETLEAAGDVVNFQVLTPYTDNDYSALVLIEDLEFVQSDNPAEWQGWGGIIKLTMRTVA